MNWALIIVITSAFSLTHAETAAEAITAAPGATTAAPGETTAAPGETTAAPGATTAAPGETTAAPGETTGCKGNYELGTAYPDPGKNLNHGTKNKTKSPKACQALCKTNPQCQLW